MLYEFLNCILFYLFIPWWPCYKKIFRQEILVGIWGRWWEKTGFVSQLILRSHSPGLQRGFNTTLKASRMKTVRCNEKPKCIYTLWWCAAVAAVQDNYCVISLLCLALEGSLGFSQWSSQQCSHARIWSWLRTKMGFHVIGWQWRDTCYPLKIIYTSRRRAGSHAGGFAFEFHVELMLGYLMYAFALFLSKSVIFVSASFYIQYFLFPCKGNPKVHWSPL